MILQMSDANFTKTFLQNMHVHEDTYLFNAAQNTSDS